MPNLKTKPSTGTVVFDLETNGLLNNATQIHCIVLHWLEDNRTETFNDQPFAPDPKDLPMGSNYSITTAISHLEVADAVIGHNIIGFDIPVIKKLYPYFNLNRTLKFISLMVSLNLKKPFLSSSFPAQALSQ